MHDVLSLIRRLGDHERAGARFLAPCVKNGRVRARIEGLVMVYTPPQDFEGWGIFQPDGDDRVIVAKTPKQMLIKRWLERFKAVRLVLIRKLDGQTWLAWPANTEAWSHRFGDPSPTPIYLVTRGRPFDVIVARHDGVFWFDQIDRRANLRLSAALRASLFKGVEPDALKLPGLTPEMRDAYRVGYGPTATQRMAMSERRVENRLRDALKTGGGSLSGYTDKGDYWQVEWVDRDDQPQISAIHKNDLTVISSGICLDGEDQKFDLQSLVGVMQGADEYW